jgi:energy-coupling factor transport system substrate-specific component
MPKRIAPSHIVFIFILLYSIWLFILPLYSPTFVLNPQNGIRALILNLIIYIGLFALALSFRLKERVLSAKEITFIAVYTAFTAVARIPFVVLPGFQPSSYLIFCAGYAFGPLVGFLVGANTAWLSNIILGQGPWTIYQIFGWGLIGLSGSLFNLRRKNHPNRWVLAIIGFIWGFVYGWLLNLWFWMIFFPPLTWPTFLLVNLNSLFFDAAHAIGNFIFMFYFGEQTLRILERYKQRFHYQIVEIQAGSQ